MLSKLHIGAVVGVATAMWIAVLWCRGEPLTLAALGSFSAVVSLTFVVVWIFDRWGWRLRLKGWCCFYPWFSSCPDIRGTWEVELRSSWTDPATGQPVPPIRCFYGVRQTCSTLLMHLMTPESESWLRTHRFVPSAKSECRQLIAVYTNQPQVSLRGDRSEIHHGTIVLDFQGPDSSRPETFSGEYWTDRGTKGTMQGKRISAQVVSRYSDGEAMCFAR